MTAPPSLNITKIAPEGMDKMLNWTFLILNNEKSSD